MKRLTITFDNGPDPDCTPYVLDVLREHSILSTFFVCGRGNALHPALPAATPTGRALLDRIREEGHWVGNHTLTHTVELGTTIDPAVVAKEIGANQDLVASYNPHRLFRPYMAGGLIGPGTFSPQAVDYLRANAYTVVLFNSCPRDWENPDNWPEAAFEHIARSDWTLMIVHDVARYRGMRQLDRFLDRAASDGVIFRQDFPDSCVPIRNGRVTGSLDRLVCADTPEEPRPLSIEAIPYINEAPLCPLPSRAH